MSAVQKSETSWTLKNYFPTTLPTPPPFSTWLTVINQALQLPVKIRGSGRRHLFAQGCHLTTFSTFHLLQWGTISFLWLAIVNPKRQIQETPISNLVPDGTAVSWSHLGLHSWHLWNDASGSPQPNPHWKSFTKDHNHCPCILLKIPCPAPSMEPSYWPSPVKGPVFGNRRKMRGPNPCQKRRRWLTCKTFCFALNKRASSADGVLFSGFWVMVKMQRSGSSFWHPCFRHHMAKKCHSKTVLMFNMSTQFFWSMWTGFYSVF